MSHWEPGEARGAGILVVTGHLYLVYARHDNKPIVQEDEERRPLAAFMIEVK